MLLIGIAVSALLLISNQVPVQGEEDFQCHILYEYDATTKGDVKSPFYGERNYHDGLWCEYRIRAPEGYRIKITFKDLDLVPGAGCMNDYLIVYSKDKESMLAHFCGSQIPNPLLSLENENEIRLLLRTDFMVTGRGFHLQYESAPNMELCEKTEGACKNRNCYPSNKKCDGVDDCGDGTDEESCGKPVVHFTDKCGETPIEPSLSFDSTDRQVGGTAAIPNSWPWQVSLQRVFVEPNGHFCGGTLISPQFVVTAGHCVVSFTHPSQVKIVLGAHGKFNKTKYEITRVAEKIITYPDLEGVNLRNMNIKHDITLIKLNAPVAYSDGIQPACLPHLGWEVQAGTSCYSTGWGETRGSGFTDVLKQTEQIVQNISTCSYDEKTQVCVDKPYNSPCHGDSGGPLVCQLGGKWHVMGATSFGVPTNFVSGLCGMPGSKVIFAKVADKGDWIRQLINKFG